MCSTRKQFTDKWGMYKFSKVLSHETLLPLFWGIGHVVCRLCDGTRYKHEDWKIVANCPSEKIWQSLDRTPTVRPHHRHTNAKLRVVCGEGFFGAKTNGNPRSVKLKQLRSSGKSTQNKKKVIVVMKSGAPFLGLAKSIYYMSHHNRRAQSIRPVIHSPFVSKNLKFAL